MRKTILKNKKRKSAVIALGSLCAACLFCGAVTLNYAKASAAEADSVSLESAEDKFVLTDVNYAAGESFAYTAEVKFSEGQAAGLVFGGDEEEKTYWVFNADRYENRVKLLYFSVDDDGGFGAKVLFEDYFIGNDNMTEGEKSKVNPKVAALDKVWLKVIVSCETDGVWAEFYADGIRRFGADNAILLSSANAGSDGTAEETAEKTEDGKTIFTTGEAVYTGGKIGYNCFNASVTFSDVYYAASDYSYYTEAYRQQYHFSQFAHWNNDPNGLVYYNGWYHLYYQHHPFSNYWSDMYWGHARSKDLAHWELLPICLFPDTESDGFGGGDGYMWSGSAMAYRKGTSAAVDEKNWFENGNGDGLIAFYTRDGATQDQVVMTSDDGGMTWTKRVRITQTTATQGITAKTDCRDPKVFPVEKSGDAVTLWGMALTGMATNDVWFLKSEDLLNWSYAGGFKAYRPECPDVVRLTADDGTEKTVMTFTGRRYLVGEISYNAATGKIVFSDLNGNDVSALAQDDIPFRTMDYGVDSYATQTYYIDDKQSEYYGKIVSVSWFSGVPGAEASIESGALAALRKTWNGGGFTIPAEWGLKKSGSDYVLTQTPIVKSSSAFEKKNKITLKDTAYTAESENPLKNVYCRNFELSLTLDNPDLADVAIRIGVGNGEYTEIGWTKDGGYYFDRSHTYDGGLAMGNYHRKYIAGAAAGVSAGNAASAEESGRKLSFYVLADNGGIEAYCDEFSVPFYMLTFISPYSQGMSLETSGGVTIENLTVNEISSVWRSGEATDETVLYLSSDKLELSESLTKQKEISAYSANGGDVSWSVAEGDDVIALTLSENGAIVTAKRAGEAKLKAICGKAEKTIPVTVYSGTADSDIALSDEGIVSGDWLITKDGLTGEKESGDGFLLSSDAGGDFTYAARFNLNGGTAAALVFRANGDMSDYYIANYDNAGHVVKLWTPHGELGNVSATADPSDVYLSVTAAGNRILVSLNGNTLIDVTDERENAPENGLFGLNVCAARVNFVSVGLEQSEYEYSAEKEFTVRSAVELSVYEAYNDTLSAKIPSAYYKASGRNVTFEKDYFTFLKAGETYTFTLKGRSGSYSFKVHTGSVPQAALSDLTIEEGTNATFFVGGCAITEVKVNGAVAAEEKYRVANGVLTLDKSLFSVGENSVEISPLGEAKVTVKALRREEDTKAQGKGCKSAVTAGGAALCVALIASAFAMAAHGRKRDGNDD